MTSDELHHAYITGYDTGFAQGRQQASEDLARDWLHEDARRWTEQATRTATANHGPGWASMIREQAEAVTQ